MDFLNKQYCSIVHETLLIEWNDLVNKKILDKLSENIVCV